MSALQITYPDRAIALLIVTDALIFIAAVMVILRLVSRCIISRSPGLDDLFAFFALITSIATIVCIDVGVRYGTGQREHDVDVNKHVLGKVRLATQILYIVSSALIKTTILFLYRRLFPALRIWIYITVGFVAALSIAIVFAAIFQCDPVGRFWVTDNEGKLNCVLTLVLWCDVAVLYLVTNIWITVLPIPTIWGLHLPYRKKFSVMALLCSTGFVACVAATVRLAYVIVLYKGDDPSYDSVPIYFASTVEISAALIASSIPPLRPAYATSMDRFQAWRKKSNISDSSGSELAEV